MNGVNEMSELLGDALSIKGWQQENAELQDELDKYKKLATQRGARMQIMLEWMAKQPTSGLGPANVMTKFIDDRPEAFEWFDHHGVPVDA
jgi:hypothetical protein